MRKLHHVILSSFLCFTIVGCSTNPVTGKREIAFVPVSAESQIGQESFLALQQADGGELITYPQVTEYVRTVGQKLVQVSDRPNLPYEFVILNNPVPNAWTLPGGKIAINSGLLMELENEAELAAVLSHEIVHAAARHGAQGLERDMAIQAGLAGMGVATEESDYHEMVVVGASVGAQLIHSKYSRKAEFEADKYGMKYMSKAGYDVSAAVKLQQTFLRLAKNGQPNWVEGLFASHPPSQSRIDANMRTATKLPVGGFVGQDEYFRIMSQLKKV
jgi:predicted Zn-dependent protease